MHHRTPPSGLPRLRPLALLTLLALQPTAWAQTAAEPTDKRLPGIVVKAQAVQATTEGSRSYTSGQASTATPLGLSLRDTPQSVSVITQQRIEDQALRTLLDVVDNTVGLSVHRFETNRVNFVARGFKITSLMLDGVPTIWDTTWTAGETLSSLSLYDRVEVVRGATGLTTGTGEPSAAVNKVRKRATSKTLTGTAELGLGRWDQRRGMVDVSTPVNESGTVRARLVGEYQSADSWVDWKEDKATSLYGTVSVDLTPDTLLSYGFTRQDNDSGGAMWGGLPYWYTDGTAAHWPRSKTTAARWTRYDSRYEDVFADLEHRFDNGWKARASVSRSNRDGDTPLLYMFGAPDRTTGLGLGTWPGWYDTHTRQDNLGISVNGPWRAAGRTHEARIGYAYTKQRFRAENRAAALGSAGDFNQWDGSFAEPDWAPWSFYQSDRTEQQAIYGVVRLNLADPLRVILGTRVTNYERTGLDAADNTYRMDFDREVTPYLGAVFDLNETYSAYVSHTDIFQPQQVRDITGRYLDPVVGKSTEAGIKAELLDGRLNASFALFNIEQEKLAQATTIDLPANLSPKPGEKAYVESKGATSKGFEFEVSGEIQPGWSVAAGYSQFRLKDAAGDDVNTIYPRKLLRLFTAYQLPGAWSALTLGGGVTWQSRTWTDAENPSPSIGVERIEQKSYALVNLMARYHIDKQWSAQVNIGNLFDKRYYGLFDAFDQITYGEPRNVTASLQYKF
jgi:outer membrane receptor for ferric coprogen and ferric-rhodotorulic acid